MLRSKFVPSAGMLIGLSVAICVLALVLGGTGAFGSDLTDLRDAARILRTVLLAVAGILLFSVFFRVFAYYRDPGVGLGNWLNVAMGCATGCLLAAWIIGTQLR